MIRSIVAGLALAGPALVVELLRAVV